LKKKKKKQLKIKTTIILYSKNQNVTCRKLIRCPTNIVRSIWPLHHQSIYQLRENKQLKCIECAKYSLNRLKINAHRKKLQKKLLYNCCTTLYTLHTLRALRELHFWNSGGSKIPQVCNGIRTRAINMNDTVTDQLNHRGACYTGCFLDTRIYWLCNILPQNTQN
jgi:hypothetical protein